MRQESSFYDEWFSFYEVKTSILLRHEVPLPIKIKRCQLETIKGSAPQKFEEWFLVNTYEHNSLFRQVGENCLSLTIDCG